MNGKVAKKLRRAAGGSVGRHRALKKLYNEGRVIDGGKDELRAQQAKEVKSAEDRRSQAEARASLLAKRPSFARYAPIKKNTAERKLKRNGENPYSTARRRFDGQTLAWR